MYQPTTRTQGVKAADAMVVPFVALAFWLPMASAWWWLPPSIPSLGAYNVNRSQVSVSGISSGANMATQFHVAHSRDVMGAGMVAGAPYMCAGGSVATSILVCMASPAGVSVNALLTVTNSAALVGNIDNTTNMRDDKVWVFAGSHDSLVNPDAGEKIEEYYNHYVTSGSVQTVFNIAAEHSMPTATYGGQCDILNTGNYINNCNYDGAFQMLNFIYGGNLQQPQTASGSLIKFDQKEFFYLALPSTYSMDTVGYVYIPSGCLDKIKACKLHIAFHGCQMGQSRLGEDYVRHAGYNEVAEANDIIVLYPQVIASALLSNLGGCWDWWGYSGALYATKSGFQMTAVYRMMDRVIE